jgi:hypothetical protein
MNRRSLLLYQFTTRVIKLTAVIIVGYYCYQLHMNLIHYPSLKLKLNTEKTKYMLLACHQNANPKHNIKTANRSFENVAQFKHMGTKVGNQNLIQVEIKRRLNLGNA